MAGKSVVRLAPLRYEAAPLRNQIIASLRSAIETGVLQPGDRLVERELCEQLNVSRTSLREALRELQALGVLSPTENRGLMVTTLSREEAENAYSIRAVLEALVARQFTEHADDEEFDQLAVLGETLKKAYGAGAVDRILRGKRAFYDCLCTGAKNALAFDFIHRLTLKTSVLRTRSLSRSERQQESIAEIAAILDAIEQRDADAAELAAAAHVRHSAASALGTFVDESAAAPKQIKSRAAS